ncbi:low-specificity L-threonine aldolase [Hwanghaeella grinnelliae]|uniref:Low-specificity L-threonine aldolase n=1 Tax=Hwanghaeella grinnelliae TaxID=2500179 RepID=A0A437QUY5_9PROT|nr:low-specificity L-threonine aldolase [Hwanghaeella grinnelliae]RVU38308.1 low-specificity L-threonine aldolase [Hwanghaeella grinnelliae]
MTYPAASSDRPAAFSGANRVIDLRSDTVTRPSQGMYDAIASAAVGDDVYGDDPTVNALEAKAADLMGKEAAVLFASGTQSNLAAVMAHCGRGEEFIIGTGYHIVTYEAMGTAVLGSVAAYSIPTNDVGEIPLDAIKGAVKLPDPHFPVTRLLSLENTHNGMPLSMDYMAKATAVVREAGLNTHLDGARVMNAAVALGVQPAEVGAYFDTVSVCLSKGLGSPVGSVLVGSADLIAKARRIRKMLGGAMRQAGVIAACGLYALENNIDRLAEDHLHASQLADGLAGLNVDGLDVVACNTNMVFVDLSDALVARLPSALLERGVQISGRSSRIRLVAHLDVSADDVDKVVSAFGDACSA